MKCDLYAVGLPPPDSGAAARSRRVTGGWRVTEMLSTRHDENVIANYYQKDAAVPVETTPFIPQIILNTMQQVFASINCRSLSK